MTTVLRSLFLLLLAMPVVSLWAGEPVITGTNGDDELQGTSGNDQIMGGDGDDTLIGGSGMDLLFGGRGADRFVFDMSGVSAGSEPARIFDFNPDDDVVVLRWLNVSDRKLGMEKIYINSRGELRMKVSGSDGSGIVDLFQSDMEFRYEADDREVVLRFKRTF